jgi:hypothetical protein
MRVPHLRDLPLAFRALFSSFMVLIGAAYLMALSYMFLSIIQPHQKMGLGLVQGIEVTYHGDPASSRIEAALRGSMASNIAPRDRDKLLQWVHNGAPEATYSILKPIFDANCVACHSAASGLPIPHLDTYQSIREVTQTDQGPTLTQLARVSHVHLFGLSIFFLLTGAIFALSSVKPWLRATIVVLPYVAIVADIGSWWLTHYFPIFGIVVVFGGAFMGAALALQLITSLWEMWFPVPWASSRARPVLDSN